MTPPPPPVDNPVRPRHEIYPSFPSRTSILDICIDTYLCIYPAAYNSTGFICTWPLFDLILLVFPEIAFDRNFGTYFLGI